MNINRYPASVVMEGLRKLDVKNLPTTVFISQAACNILGTAYGILVNPRSHRRQLRFPAQKGQPVNTIGNQKAINRQST